MEDKLLTINNQNYFIDIDELSTSVKVDPKVIVNYLREAFETDDDEFLDNFNPSTMLNVPKYEMIKMMMDVLFSLGFHPNAEAAADLDPTERIIRESQIKSEDLNSLPISFKLAFNTLLINKIIKNYEPTARENRTINPKAKR
jgi:hypothetical protein